MGHILGNTLSWDHFAFLDLADHRFGTILNPGLDLGLVVCGLANDNPPPLAGWQKVDVTVHHVGHLEVCVCVPIGKDGSYWLHQSGVEAKEEWSFISLAWVQSSFSEGYGGHRERLSIVLCTE